LDIPISDPVDLTRVAESRVAIAGDWDEHFGWAFAVLRSLRDTDPAVHTLLHLGDFGLFPDAQGEHYLRTLDKICRGGGVDRILVTPGEREHWGWLDHLFASEPGSAIQLSDAVWVLPRGYRFRLAEATFLSFGGAASIDASLLTEDIEWWPSELARDAEFELALSGGKVDVMLTHEAVDGGTLMVDAVNNSNVRGLNELDREYSAWSRRSLTRLWHDLSPKVLTHAHMHLADQNVLDDGRRVYALDRFEHSRNIGVLNLVDLDWSWHDFYTAKNTRLLKGRVQLGESHTRRDR
jgi:hypothetical protein